MTHPVRPLAAALGAAGVAAITGCSSSGGSAAPAAGPTPPTAGTGQRIVAVETNFHIALSRTTVPPGTYTFVARNEGQSTHALEIDGPGVSDRATQDINPGQSTTLTVTLQKGSYEIYCPIDGHKQLGMDTHLTVS